MKKRILSLTLIALSFVSFAAIAQNIDTDTQISRKSEKVKSDRHKKGDKKLRKGDGKKEFNPFEGMNLTEDQQNSLSALKGQRKADKQKMKQERKAEKQVRDSVNRAERGRMKEARKQNKKEYLEQVKAIVGSDNYVIFLENMVVNNAPGKGVKSINKKMRKGEPRHSASQGKGGKKSRKSGSEDSRREVRIPSNRTVNS